METLTHFKVRKLKRPSLPLPKALSFLFLFLLSFLVAACALGGRCEEAKSGPLVVDASAPLSPRVNKDPHFPSDQSLQVSWEGCTDPHSGIGMNAVVTAPLNSAD